MDMQEQEFTLERMLSGTDGFDVAAGDRFKVIAGESEVYNEKVPAGKTWRVNINVTIQESSV
jgi:hypothetical protein